MNMNKSKIFLLAALSFMMVACEKHDLFDENCITGQVGPEAYWELESSAVMAGSELGFNAQYYSSVTEIDHSELWYSLDETVNQTVICPWVSTFSYSVTSSITEHKRVLQKIKSYAHDEAYWNDSLHAYAFQGTFPVSGTLAPLRWVQPTTFDSAKMIQYFGEGFMQSFKDGMHDKMQYADYKKMLLGLGYMDDFKQYTDSALDLNAGEDVYKYYFKTTDGKPESEILSWVKDSMDYYWNQITFEQLVNNTANGYYDVEYVRTYKIDAELRVYDANNVYSKTVSKSVDIN